MKRIAFVALGLALSLGWTPALAQSSAQPVVTGYLSMSGCSPNPAPCFVQYGSSGGGLPIAMTPAAGAAHAIVTGGTAVTAVTGPVNGCYIVNPLTATDQGIVTAEPLYLNPVTTATTTGNSTTTALQPGQSFSCVPGQTTSVSANAATSSHAFGVVKW